METKGLSFPDAVRFLAEKVGITMANLDPILNHVETLFCHGLGVSLANCLINGNSRFLPWCSVTVGRTNDFKPAITLCYDMVGGSLSVGIAFAANPSHRFPTGNGNEKRVPHYRIFPAHDEPRLRRVPPVLSILRSRATAEDGRSRATLASEAGCGGWRGSPVSRFRATRQARRGAWLAWVSMKRNRWVGPPLVRSLCPVQGRRMKGGSAGFQPAVSPIWNRRGVRQQ